MLNLTAFVTYDWLINFDEEIRCFWDFSKGRRLNAAALIYGLSRYPPMILIILQLRTVFPMSDKVRPSCRRLTVSVGWLINPQACVFQTGTIIRAY